MAATLAAACHAVAPYDPVVASVARDAASGATADALPQPYDPCSTTADSNTVALFTFEGADRGKLVGTGLHNVEGTVMGHLAVVPGPPSCAGPALLFADAPASSPCPQCNGVANWDCRVPTNYAVLPFAVGAALSRGAVDFWVRLRRLPAGMRSERQGMLSRDAAGQQDPGHLSVYRLASNGIGVRLQGATTEEQDVRCSAPQSEDEWHHVGINFGGGPLELYIDGLPATDTNNRIGGMYCAADSALSLGIDGNQEPWVLGGSTVHSCRYSHEPVTHPLHGELANLRISNVRRAFGRERP